MTDSDSIMSRKQAELLRSLAVETLGENEGHAHLAQLRSTYPRPTRAQASEWITALKERKAANPVTAPPQARGGFPSVAAGRYAITGDDGELRLYRVDRPESGRFAGYTFVKWIRDGGYESRLSPVQAKAVLAKMAANPLDALVAYGRQTGICGKCGRTLTDPESVNAGIGPICAAKVGP